VTNRIQASSYEGLIDSQAWAFMLSGGGTFTTAWIILFLQEGRLAWHKNEARWRAESTAFEAN